MAFCTKFWLFDLLLKLFLIPEVSPDDEDKKYSCQDHDNCDYGDVQFHGFIYYVGVPGAISKLTNLCDNML